MLDTGRLCLNGNALQIFQQGLAFAAAKEYEKAVESYGYVLQLAKNCAEVWYERSLALECLGNYQEAIASNDWALRLDPDPDLMASIWSARGNALQYGLGEYRDAIGCYDRSLQIKPDTVQPWYHRANALLYGLRCFEEALANYGRALMIDGNYQPAWRNRGDALMELRRYPEAIGSYDQALLLDPTDELALHGRTCALNHSTLEERQPTTRPVSFFEDDFDEDTELSGSENSQQNPTELDVLSDSAILRIYPLLIIEDMEGRREIVLQKILHVVGRDPQSDIRLYSFFASRHHAILLQFPQADGTYSYRIVDGNLQGKRSTNGLVINGRKRSSWNLTHNDTVVLGSDVRLIYFAPSAKI